MPGRERFFFVDGDAGNQGALDVLMTKLRFQVDMRRLFYFTLVDDFIREGAKTDTGGTLARWKPRWGWRCSRTSCAAKRLAGSWDDLVGAHDRWREDYNAQRHWAHEGRQDGRRSPEAVLGFYTGLLRYREEDLRRAFFSTRFSRFLDGLGYARFRDWRLYGEEGLARREAAVWLQPGSLTLEYAGETLSVYDVELAPDSGKPRTVGRPRLFETSYQRSWPQLRLFALDGAGWLKALKLEGYVPRRLPSPMTLQEALFPYLDAL